MKASLGSCALRDHKVSESICIKLAKVLSQMPQSGYVCHTQQNVKPKTTHIKTDHPAKYTVVKRNGDPHTTKLPIQQTLPINGHLTLNQKGIK